METRGEQSEWSKVFKVVALERECEESVLKNEWASAAWNMNGIQRE